MRARKSFKALRGARTVLAFDPGYASLGWAAALLYPDGIAPLALGVVETRKDEEPGWSRVGGKAPGARAEEKRRVTELATGVHTLVEQFAPVAILTEGFSPTRDSSVSSHLAMTWSVLFLEALHRGLPFHDVSPQDLKEGLCGSRKAEKRDVEEALARMFGAAFLREMLLGGGTRWGAREHPFDALAAAVALAPRFR